jgi:hypothetical protein
MGINAHRLFYSSTAADTYLNNLTLGDGVREELRAVRDDIRETLKAGFADWDRFVDKHQFFEAAAFELADQRPLRPKFRMQGSWSYHTLNCATFDPPQEIDLDDGMFLPVSFLTQDGTVKPSIVSDAYFEAVEVILGPLCEERGWSLEEKSSCVRVRVRDGAHADIALYAIPDEDFEQLVAKAEYCAANSFGKKVTDEAIAFDTEIYPNLPADHIMLAHRDEGWKPSDPRKLENWFQDAIHRHREQLRRVCRYLKGWRDFNWKDGCRLSSIAIMACVVDAFDNASRAPRDNRDDEALKMAVDRMVELLPNAIPNPVVDGQRLDEGWEGEDCRKEFLARTQRLASVLNDALQNSDASHAMAALCAEFGHNLPNYPDHLLVDEVATPAVLRSGLLGGSETNERRSPVKIGGSERYG